MLHSIIGRYLYDLLLIPAPRITYHKGVTDILQMQILIENNYSKIIQIIICKSESIYFTLIHNQNANIMNWWINGIQDLYRQEKETIELDTCDCCLVAKPEDQVHKFKNFSGYLGDWRVCADCIPAEIKDAAENDDVEYLAKLVAHKF